MILIDDRVGSKELLPYFPKGLAELDRLEFADLSWLGNGPDGIASIGVERKRLRDLLNSMQSGRLAGHQLLGLLNSYDIVYLIVEGIWRSGPATGLLEELRGNMWKPVALGRRQFMRKEVDGFLNTLEVCGQVVVRTTSTERETGVLVTNTYHWWQKEWEDHKSHLAMHKRRFRETGVRLEPPSVLRRVAAELTGIGWGRSELVEARFDSIREMVNASEEDWLSIKGIGKKIAGSVQEELG